uniref:F-box domain-containing protein n=1 Tax=Timema poppense TaxID=170557 RepID=A0A7R9DP20_TIMPO|nr:unnamed protein product [Timema poppensis]
MQYCARRLLDPASLLSSALVNRKWLRVCRGDAVLRTRIRQQLRRVRRNRVEHAGSRVTVTRDLQQQSSNRLFAHRNHNGKVVSGGEQAGSPMRPQFWPSREVSVAYKMTSRPRTQSLRFRQVPTAVPLRPRANSAPESTLEYRRPIRL